MTPRSTLLHCFLMICLIMAAGRVAPQSTGHLVSMWQINGASNRIYLLGSVHVLRQQDYPIPTAIEKAYQDAEILIMEIDVDDLDPIEMAGMVKELGVIKDGSTLQEIMGPSLYEEAADYASQLDIPFLMLAQTEPWLAAITIEQMMLLRIGFNPEYGIEFHLSAKASEDSKEILGLESVREQLEFLDKLSLSAQRSLLIQTLRESLNIEENLDLLIDAWRHGDIDFLEENLLAEMQRYPELYRTLIVDRNEAWVEQIRNLIGEQDDYLIVVGTLHLVGDDGLPALLSEIGITTDQLREPGS
ncbi:MAG: TraB/GumN family protein [Woeseiaceae bacterium]